MSNDQVELRPSMPPPLAPFRKKSVFDLTNLSLVLVIYNFILAIPLTYSIAIPNRRIFQYLGYEKIMRSPCGILATKLLFITINVFLILSWAKQLGDEEWIKKEERMSEIRRQVQWWDREIERLEGLLGGGAKRQRQLVEQAAIEQAEHEFDEQLKTDLLMAKKRDYVEVSGEQNYERDSVVNEDGVKEWDFVTNSKSPMREREGGLKGLSLGLGSKIPKSKKKKKLEEAEDS